MGFGEPVKTVSRCFTVCISGMDESVSGGPAILDRQVLMCVVLEQSLFQSRYGADCEAGTLVSFMAFCLHNPDRMFASNFQIV
jgi:hypothetical protein